MKRLVLLVLAVVLVSVCVFAAAEETFDVEGEWLAAGVDLIEATVTRDDEGVYHIASGTDGEYEDLIYENGDVYGNSVYMLTADMRAISSDRIMCIWFDNGTIRFVYLECDENGTWKAYSSGPVQKYLFIDGRVRPVLMNMTEYCLKGNTVYLLSDDNYASGHIENYGDKEILYVTKIGEDLTDELVCIMFREGL